MKSQVFFIKVEDAEDIVAVNDKLRLLLAKSHVLASLKGVRRSVIKLHFGEEGTTGYVRSEHLRLICLCCSEGQKRQRLFPEFCPAHKQRMRLLGL